MFLKLAFYYYRQDNPNSSINSDSKVFAMKNEFDYIRDFLVQQKEADKRFYRICFHFRMDGYLYTLSMLADQYKLQLAEIIKNECALYEEKGETSFSRFPKEKRKIIQEICEDFVGYIQQQVQKNEKVREKIRAYKHDKSCYNKDYHIVIYGVGSYGRQVYAYIQRNIDKDCIIDFAVTDLKGEKMYYYDKVIKEIADFSGESTNCIVILSVKPDTQAYMEMMKKLQELQFENIVPCEEIICKG